MTLSFATPSSAIRFACLAALLSGYACSSSKSATPSAHVGETLVPASSAARAWLRPLENVVAHGVATGFRSDGGRVRAKLPDSMRPAVSVTLPASADGAVEIADTRSSVSTRFALDGAAKAPIAVADGIAVYRAALAGADVLHRVDQRGIEDFVVVAARPTTEAVQYSVDVSRVAGLRQIGQGLELLDATGAPRLRVLPPVVVDNAGRSHRARLAVTGCAVDRDPRGPWRRAVTPPGASACTLHVDWTGTGVTYPAIVDPHWVATSDMAAPRAAHTATLLEDGTVLVTGGGNDESSAELYDEGTDTFASTGAMTTARSGHSATRLQDGTVLIASGGAGPLGFILSTEIYDPTTGTFTASGDELEMHGGAPAILLNDGKVLVAGGNNHFGTTDGAELYDPATGQFTSTGTMIESRANYSATLLDDGKVLFAGGEIAVNPGELASAELYDPATGQFTSTGSLSDLRAGHTGTLLADGKVLIAGGYDAPNLTTEIYDPATGVFSLGPDLASAQSDQEAVRLLDGTVVIAGGGDDMGFTKTAQLYDPAAGTVTLIDPMLSPRSDFTLTMLPSGNALAAGGFDAGGAVQGLFSAERLVAGTAKVIGAGCTAAAECTSGFCVDGVCCEVACDGQCEACNEPGKAGTCEAVTGAPRAPRTTCAGAGDACAGQCDGTHRKACGYPTTALSCGSSCGDGMLTTSHCDGAGACAADAPVACPDNLGCADVTSCATQCKTTADCTADHVCVAGQCVGACDGDHTVTHADGSTVDCAPYLCAASSCRTDCSSNADCVAPATCSAGKCTAPASDAGAGPGPANSTDSGCSVQAHPRRAPGAPAWLMALALAVFARRRRHG